MASDTATRKPSPKGRLGRVTAGLTGLHARLGRALFSRLALGILTANLVALGFLALWQVAFYGATTGLVLAMMRL